MSIYIPASYASTEEMKDKIYRLAFKYHTSPSWLNRFLIDWALARIDQRTIASAVKADPEARKRAVS